MTTTTNPDKSKDTEPPLWSIATAMIVILGAPLVLYSLAPTGPIREGDTVFSEGQQHVRIYRVATAQPSEVDHTCLLDPSSPLIVIRPPTNQAEDSILAQVQGNPTNEWPFCPVHAEIALKVHQVFQKPAVFRTVRELLTKVFSP
jgi:hypothetical protein